MWKYILLRYSTLALLGTFWEEQLQPFAGFVFKLIFLSITKYCVPDKNIAVENCFHLFVFVENATWSVLLRSARNLYCSCSTTNVCVCTFESVLACGDCLDKYLRFSWHHFWRWFATAFFLGLGEGHWSQNGTQWESTTLEWLLD